MKINISSELKTLLTLTLSTLLISCTSSNDSQTKISVARPGEAVIGGDKVNATDVVAKSTVGLFDKSVKSLCTGTLIAEDLILTAAHCVEPGSEQMIVYFGTDLNKIDDSKVRKVLNFKRNPLYNVQATSDMNDIALIHFEGTLPEGFVPAKILPDFSLLSNDSKVTVAGYGLSWSWIVKTGAGVLRTTQLKIKNSLVGNIEMMLDQSLKKGICSGDSGGPAYLESNGELFLAGVASRGDSIPIPFTPNCFIISIFTRVETFQSWIVETAAELRNLN